MYNQQNNMINLNNIFKKEIGVHINILINVLDFFIQKKCFLDLIEIWML
jgi:hypothetical protein